jgi:Fe2+ transport system protein FeoA
MLPVDPEVTLSRFMTAVQANDLVSMSQLWGTKDGPAARRMDRAELNQRLRVMQIMLKHEQYEIAPDASMAGLDDRTRAYRLRLMRMGCQVDVPFQLVRVGDGWLVSVIDLTQAGNPARTCR